MGKDNKGKELGVGLSQRKDGRYSARFVSRSGKRVEKYFDKFQEARRWLAEVKEEDETKGFNEFSFITVDEWYNYYIENIKKATVRNSSLRSYSMLYRKHIKNQIGDMRLCEVKPIHVQRVLYGLKEKMSDNSISLVRTVLSDMCKYAEENDIISSNPVRKVKSVKTGEKYEPRVLSVEEHQRFLEGCKTSPFFNQYAFVLQTGVRVGEMMGLRWEDVDFDNRTISIKRSIEYFGRAEGWQIGYPKTASGHRKIPMTEECFRILTAQRERNIAKPAEMFGNLVFASGKETPYTLSAYNRALGRITKEIGIKGFTMHALRHTFATRCIEAGMKPKALQKLLGHSNISMTMDLYVHMLEDEKCKEMEKLEGYYSEMIA